MSRSLFKGKYDIYYHDRLFYLFISIKLSYRPRDDAEVNNFHPFSMIKLHVSKFKVVYSSKINFYK